MGITEMTWYAPIECENAVNDPYVAGAGELKGVGGGLWQGTPIINWDETSWVKATDPNDDGDPDDVLQTYLGEPIYSPRLRRTLEQVGITGIQYLPIRVLRPDDSEIPGFAIANILHRIAALDFERSRYTLHPANYFKEERRGEVSMLIRPVLLGSVIGGLDVIRLHEHAGSYFVSGRFKKAFEEGGFTGYSFQEVEVGGRQ